MNRYWIGIDDTDAGESIGTGALARELMLYLQRLAGARACGITRHQLLIDPAIPYTSHNSAACLVVECAISRREVTELSAGLLRTLLHEGADPGLCVCDEQCDNQLLHEIGHRAQTEVLDKAEVLAQTDGMALERMELGGEGIGIIGAIAACGLRRSGEDGRFISLPGIRDVGGTMTVQELLARTPIDEVRDQSGEALESEASIDTRDWVRPELRGGRIVLPVQRTPDGAAVVVKNKKLDKH